jgi:hypothetical protein
MRNGREHPPIWDGEMELTNSDAGRSGSLGRFSMFLIGYICGVVSVLAMLMVAFEAAAEGPVAQPTPMRLQVLCMDIEVMESILDADLGQRLAQMGTRLSGEQVLLFLNPDTRSFTLGFLRESDGLFCGLGAGERWDMPGLTATRGVGL